MINTISASITTELESHTNIGTLSEYRMLAAGKEWRTKKENVWRVGWGRRGSAGLYFAILRRQIFDRAAIHPWIAYCV